MIDRRHLMRLAAFAAMAPAMAHAANTKGSAFDFSFETLERRGGLLPLAEFQGSPTLVVNTASKCGFTPQYEGLQALWSTYKDRGLTVIGAPSRDFGGQEFTDEAKIADFCATTYAVDFPLTELVKVKGPDAHPFYRWARSQAEAQKLPTPRWNFHKYLIGPDGALAGAWSTQITPQDPRILAAIEALVPAKD
ncbi:MAG: glutathione peroxidase [Paracoccaceae bacterium]|jgi:glutathione peroxidase